jgi:major type 1 subunit fimbrin (pilin)
MTDAKREESASLRRLVVRTQNTSRRRRTPGLALRVCAALAFAGAGPAYAADATVSFSGTFLQPSCTVDSSSANQTISLGTASIVEFPSVGSTKNPQSFSVNLTGCAPGTQVTMTVVGTVDTVTSVLQNTGTATQVGIQLLQASSVGATTGTPITLNSAKVIGVVDTTNSMTIPMVAQFYRLGSVGAGTVTSTATINFMYN